MAIIKGNRVIRGQLMSMTIEEYKQFQLENMKMFCSLMISPVQNATKMHSAEMISNIQYELVEQFGFTWEEMERLETEYYNVA